MLRKEKQKTNTSKDLTQYLFLDRHEEIFNLKGKLIAVRDPVVGVNDYLPFESKLHTRYIHGSAPSYNSKRISRRPLEGEYLITGSWFLGWSQKISNARIKQINKGFQLP